MINNKYKLVRYLSQGNFGTVIECSYNNKNYAIKCDGDSKLLKYEANIYKELRSIKNISTLVDFFIIDNRSYMVLDLFELNLKDYKDRFFTSKYYIERLIELMNKVIDITRDIHNHGVVH